MNRHTVFFFNMIEIALALVILAIGLSSVLVLFPIGLQAGKSSVADNNLANVAEQVMAYLQSELTAPANWTDAGEVQNVSIAEFTAEPDDDDIPKDLSQFGKIELAIVNNDGTATGNKHNLEGLSSYTKDGKTYYLYRQYSDIAASESANEIGSAAEAERAVDFEAMIRVGLDTATLKEQYYPVAGDSSPGDVGGQRQLTNYTRPTGDVANQPSRPFKTEFYDEGGGGNISADNLLKKSYKTLIVEFSWPADAPWSKREKRVFRLELFNENFVPYPKRP